MSAQSATLTANRTTRRRLAIWTAGSLVALGAVGAGVAYALGCFDANPRLAEVRQLQAKLADHTPQSGQDNKEKLAVLGDLFKKVSNLPPDLRKAAGAGFQQVIIQHVTDVLAMPPDMQTAQLDKDIDFALAIQQEIAKRRADAQAGQNTSGAGPTGNGSAADRAARRNQMLSSVPADVRAQWTTYTQLMQARASQRGVSLPGFGR
ncbi:MAG TPA: hypothetical protein VGY55_20025 [Pirellulales bacterium]|jgi:hypothetical protein|nr:hypothetical protein [Pirellulales bacterium]